MVTQRSRQESLADEKQREKKKKKKEFKERHKQWLEDLKKKKPSLYYRGPYKGPPWNPKTMTPEERKKAKEQAEKYRAKTKAKGGIVKKNKGGLMVAPKRAKRGY